MWIGVLVIVGMCLYPPWNDTFKSSSRDVKRPLGYAPIYRPPSSERIGYAVAIDLTRLGIQVFAVSLITGLLFMTNGAKRPNDSSGR